jgi:hypothetical protein
VVGVVDQRAVGDRRLAGDVGVVAGDRGVVVVDAGQRRQRRRVGRRRLDLPALRVDDPAVAGLVVEQVARLDAREQQVQAGDLGL